MRRAFEHTEMKEAAKSFAGGTIPQKMASTLSGSIDPRLSAVASAFVDLQEARHEADYDLARSFTRREVLDLVGMAENAFASWKAVRQLQESRLFLVSFLTFRKLKSR